MPLEIDEESSWVVYIRGPLSVTCLLLLTDSLYGRISTFRLGYKWRYNEKQCEITEECRGTINVTQFGTRLVEREPEQGELQSFSVHLGGRHTIFQFNVTVA